MAEEIKMAPAAYQNKQTAVHITKVKCVPSGHGVRQFLLYCVVLNGKKAGTELHVPMRAAEAEAALKYWTDLTAMPIDQHYEFESDDRPIASIVYRNNQPSYASNVQVDYAHRAKVINDMMIVAGLGGEYNTAENRELIRSFDTTSQAKQWAEQYIELRKKVTDKPIEKTDGLDEAFGRSVITHNAKSRGEYFSRANAIFQRYEFDEAEWDWRSKEALGELKSHDDYAGESVDQAVRTIALYCMDKKPDHEAVMQDFKMLMIANDSQLAHFKAATGYANRADAYQNGKTASELYIMVEQWLEGRKVKSNEKATKVNDELSGSLTTPKAIVTQNPVPQSVPAKTDEPEVSEAEFVDETPKALAVREVAFTGRALFPTKQEQSVMAELAEDGFKSGLLPNIKSLAAAKFIVETGRELGIPPSLALRKIQIIQGQPALAAELMWALVLNSGLVEDFEIDEQPNQCTVMVKRSGKRPYTTTFTLEMAGKIMTKENGNTIPMSQKYNWRAMPGVMCKWRALSAACRTIFPDVTLGVYSREEMEDNIDFTAAPELATAS